MEGRDAGTTRGLGAEGAAALPVETLLVARVRAGEAAAFHDLFQRYRRLVLSLATRLLNDAEEANDLCQEVFLVVHRRIAGLREPEKLRSWICRITVTRAANVERSFRRRLRAQTVPLESCLAREREPACARVGPERALESAQARERIDAALAALPFPYRSVVVLRDVEGLSYEEIADAVEANVGTVKSRIARGREALREQLQDLLRSRREGRP